MSDSGVVGRPARTAQNYVLAGAAGFAGLAGLSIVGALAAGLDAVIRVRPRVAGPTAVVTEVGRSPVPGCDLTVTLQGPGVDQPGYGGIFTTRGRLLAGPPSPVDDGWQRHVFALPGAASPLLEPGSAVTVTADPWADCDDPFSLGAVTTELPTAIGPLNVTTLQPPVPTRRAVVYLHGRSGHRQTGWWLAPTAVDTGWRAVLPGYRNDDDGPRTGRYLLGGEWVDLVHVLDQLAAEGIDEVVLAGWSMGGNIAASYLRQRHRTPARFAHHPRPVGLILDAAALDWGTVMRHTARGRGLPNGLVPGVMAYGQLSSRIDWRMLNHLHDPAHLDLPILALHGTDDATVPAALSERLASTLADVRFESFEGAGHCRSVNVDPGRYLSVLRDFLGRLS